MKKQINIVILAAGISSKMKNHDPRSCLPVNETTILIDDQISKLRDVYKNPNISIVSGYKSDKMLLAIKSKKVNIIHNENYINTNSAGSLSLAISALSDKSTNILAIPCDLFFNQKTIEYIANIHYSDGSCIIYDSSEQLHKNKLGVLVHDSKLCNFSYSHKPKYSGIVFFNNVEYKSLLHIQHKKNYQKKYVHELITEILEINNCSFYAHSPPLMKIIEIDSIKDIKSEEFKEINK